MPGPPAPQPLWLLERLLRRFPGVLIVVGSGAVIVNELSIFGAELNSWDWLLVTGFSTWLAAVYFPLLLPDKLTETLTRLTNRGVLVGKGNPDQLLALLHRKARHNALIWAIIFAGAIVAAFVVAFRDRVGHQLLLLTVEALAAVPVGLFVGRAISYGLLARRLTQAGFTLIPDPDHLDGAAGLRPVGVLYFYQSGLLAIPGAFLAAWWLFIPLLGDRYLNWREPYAGLLFVVVVSEILVFILPMVSFHRLMLDRKNDLFGEADELSRRSVRPDDAGANENWAKRYAAIESMPTWPVDLRIRRRFGLRNALLLVPAVAQALGASQRTQDLIENLRTVLTG